MELIIWFGIHPSHWTTDMLKSAIRQLFQEHYLIDRARKSETKAVLVVRLERFQWGLTQEEEHVRNIELKARNDQAQAQIDNLRNPNSNLEARPFLEVTHRQFWRESRHDLSTILNFSQSILNEPHDYGPQFQRLHQLLTRFSEKDKTRCESCLRRQRW